MYEKEKERVLGILKKEGSLHITGIARILKTDKPKTQRILAEMEIDGLVKYETYGRSKVYSLVKK